MNRRRMGRASALILLGLAPFGCDRGQVKPVVPPPAVVTVAQPVMDYVADYEDFTGRTDAVYSINITARVSGYLDKVYFKDGDEVKEGDLLFEIDPRPYKAELDRTEAVLAQSEAHYKRLDADYKRAANLFSRGNISREEFDKYAGDRSEAEAAVGVSRASFDLAKLNMAFTKINAPITGRLSRRLVDPGNLVKADETSMTTVVSLDPLYVYFDVDERTLLRLRRLVGEKKIPSREEQDIGVLAALSDEDDFPHKGLINFSDNRVDPGTGTLRIRATLKNPKPRLLSPGLFMKVRLPVGAPRKTVMVAEKALGTDQGQKYVYLVLPVTDADRKKEAAKAAEAKSKTDEAAGHGARKVAAKPKDEPKAAPGEPGKLEYQVVKKIVKVGKLDSGMREIESGLDTGQWVVVEGLQRVRPGLKVSPKTEAGADAPIMASPNPAPAPPADAKPKSVASRADAPA